MASTFDQLPAPLGVAATALLALLVSAMLLTHWERGLEQDPQLRAHAGLINAESDISLVRTANFGRALATIRAHAPSGSVMRDLTVAPSGVDATLVLASGAETRIVIAPGVEPKVTATGNRVSDHSGIALETIQPSVPEHILRLAQRRYALRPKELERLDLTPASADGGTWVGRWSQPVDAGAVAADLRGHHVHRYGFGA